TAPSAAAGSFGWRKTIAARGRRLSCRRRPRCRQLPPRSGYRPRRPFQKQRPTSKSGPVTLGSKGGKRGQKNVRGFVLTLIACGQGLAAERQSAEPPQPALEVILEPEGARAGGKHSCCPPPEEHFLKRIHPVGGWHPYGGGLLHWWPPHCFPCG